MDQKQQRKAARQFAKDWEGRGYEKGDTHAFWLELLRKVVGITGTTTKCKFEHRTANGGFIDCYIPDCKTLIEQKALGVDLDKPEERQGRMVTPYQQALSYAQSFTLSLQPRFIIVSDFGTFRIHDREKTDPENDYVEFSLSELPDHFTQFSFMADPEHSRSALEEQVSMSAGFLIGKLHEELLRCYIDPESEASKHSLNVLCVRLVFCLYCEDADLFEKDSLLNYLKPIPAENIRTALKKLFKVLDTPKDQRDPYDTELNRFPYVNGGLFAEDVEIPNFTDNLKHLLLFDASQQTDWSKISPTIFGGIFESTLNPETRRKGGMHYTSPENIHKVIDPLFMDDLHAEFNGIMGDSDLTPKKRKNKLREFRNKIGSMRFFDPACGSGNFLTETYLCLRELEDDVLNALNDGQMLISFDEGLSSDERVSLDQFYGIEINDFAVRVAKTALWIAQLQADRMSESLFNLDIERFPLSDSANVYQGNALRMDWNDVLPADHCDFIMGNPPFLGYSNQSPEQKSEMIEVWKDRDGKPIKQAGKIDYVSAWYYRAAEYTRNTHSLCAFVSTNSICQGEQVKPIWQTLYELFDVTIDFAWKTFIWGNEANDQAHVHVVIIGFSTKNSNRPKRLFTSGERAVVDVINGYLSPAPNIFVTKAKRSLCNAPLMTTGNRPADGGNLIIEDEDYSDFIAKEPEAKKYIRPLLGSREFINGKKRWCLWLANATASDIKNMPLVLDRIKKCKEDREAATDSGRRKLAATPMLFREQNESSHDYLVVPKVSSERRRYIPTGYINAEIISTDLLFVVLNGGLYEFGIITSQVHNAWMRTVAGRLKSDYRYSQDLVYNTFPWPDSSEDNKLKIEQLARNVLDARKLYSDCTLADLYDPDNDFLYPELMAAHKALDVAVEEAYGVKFDGDEEKIVAHLFKLYAKLTEGE